MFYLIFKCDADLHIDGNRYTILGKFATIEEAMSARFVSGDLIVDRNKQIVKNQNWLFDWEKANPNCYAQRMIRNGIKLRSTSQTQF